MNYSEVFTVSKKITVSVLAVLLVCTSLFAGCSKKGEYVNPATGKEYDLVTDDDGNKVLSDDGELLVYAKDENGEYVTDENGEKVTQVQGFIGQLEENGVVEDYAYKILTPDGWEFAGNGKFRNKNGTVEVTVSIPKYTLAKENDLNNKIAKGLVASGYDCVIEQTHIDAIDADGTLFKMKSDETSFSVASFMKEGNLFRVQVMAAGVYDTDSALDTFLSAMTFKPYKYYDDSEIEDVEPAVTEDAESTTAAEAE